MESILSPAQSSASPTSSTFHSFDHSPLCMPAAPLREAGGAGVALGLVSSQTSGTETHETHSHQLILVDRKDTRLKKMRSSIVTTARLHVEGQPDGFRKQSAAFITLTYRPDVEWSENHSSMVIRHMRQWFKRRGHKMRFVWCMELHKDGRPHYHALVWLPKGLTIPKPDKRGWWPHGSTNIQWARNPVGYIAKYASKGEHSGFKFPAGARIYGSGGLTGDALDEARWWKLPAWARELSQPSDKLRRRIGGGILNPDTGEVLLTPWRVRFISGQVYIYRVDEQELERCREIFLRAA